jgi:hypothetical protein
MAPGVDIDLSARTEELPGSSHQLSSPRNPLHATTPMLCFVHAKCPNGGEVKGNLQHQAFRREVSLPCEPKA